MSRENSPLHARIRESPARTLARQAITHDELVAACTRIRADYQRLSPAEQATLRLQATEWLLAWQDVLNPHADPREPYHGLSDQEASQLRRVRLAHPRGFYEVVDGPGTPERRLTNGALGSVIETGRASDSVWVHFDEHNHALSLPRRWLVPAPSVKLTVEGYYDWTGHYTAFPQPVEAQRLGRRLYNAAGEALARLDPCGDWVRPVGYAAGLKLPVVVSETRPAPPA